jgi:hypothetical protein
MIYMVTHQLVLLKIVQLSVDWIVEFGIWDGQAWLV